jgi:sulfatase maturation enzyme AslB (radical SAM superfamily)
MVMAPEFDSLDQMENSEWLTQIRQQMHKGQWPQECVRCQETDSHSVRRFAEQLHNNTKGVPDYLQVGGVLDNLCNSACMTCNEHLSTRIGSIKGRVFPIVNNRDRFWNLPQHRIAHLDINGGEPSFSKNYREILANLPPNLLTLRLNTNCSTVLTELSHVARSTGIEVTVTVSCDGIGAVHDLIRWPIPWSKFYENLMIYRSMPVDLNLWTTVSILNVHDLPNIQKFAQQHGLEHSYAYLKTPLELSVDYNDPKAAEEYIREQKKLRGLECE